MRECCTLSNDEERSQATKHLLLNINDFGLEVLHQAMLAISTTNSGFTVSRMEALNGFEVEAVDVRLSKEQLAPRSFN